jgi:hypothetical protein
MLLSGYATGRARFKVATGGAVDPATYSAVVRRSAAAYGCSSALVSAGA